MHIRKPRLCLVPVLILVPLLVSAVGVNAQCAVTNQTTTTFTTGTDLIVITKTLSMAGDCVTTAQNASGCGRAPAAMAATMLIASALTNTMNPYCSWVCDCGPGFTSESITIDSSDGLPVELMEFEIADLDDAAAGDEEQAVGALETDAALDRAPESSHQSS